MTIVYDLEALSKPPAYPQNAPQKWSGYLEHIIRGLNKVKFSHEDLLSKNVAPLFMKALSAYSTQDGLNLSQNDLEKLFFVVLAASSDGPKVGRSDQTLAAELAEETCGAIQNQWIGEIRAALNSSSTIKSALPKPDANIKDADVKNLGYDPETFDPCATFIGKLCDWIILDLNTAGSGVSFPLSKELISSRCKYCINELPKKYVAQHLPNKEDVISVLSDAAADAINPVSVPKAFKISESGDASRILQTFKRELGQSKELYTIPTEEINLRRLQKALSEHWKPEFASLFTKRLRVCIDHWRKNIPDALAYARKTTTEARAEQDETGSIGRSDLAYLEHEWITNDSIIKLHSHGLEQVFSEILKTMSQETKISKNSDIEREAAIIRRVWQDIHQPLPTIETLDVEKLKKLVSDHPDFKSEAPADDASEAVARFVSGIGHISTPLPDEAQLAGIIVKHGDSSAEHVKRLASTLKPNNPDDVSALFGEWLRGYAIHRESQLHHLSKQNA